jgi:membrane protease YdiL (CAAX protease family)
MKLFKGYLKCIFFYLLTEMILFFIGGGISYFLSQEGYSNSDFPILSIIGHPISAIVITLIVLYYFNLDYIQVKSWIKPTLKRMNTCFGFFIISFFLFGLIIFISKRFQFINGHFFDSIWNPSISIISKLFISSLIVGFSEELVFRGFLTSYFIRNAGYIFTIVMIPILFSIGHVNYETVISYLSAFIFGVLMTLFVIWTKSIYPAIGFHSGWNFSYALFQQEFDYETSITDINKVKFEYMQFGFLVLVLVILVIFLIKLKFIKDLRLDIKESA